jgi:ankyrin repeat protein
LRESLIEQERRIVARASAWSAALALLAVSPFAVANEALLAAAMRGDAVEVRTLLENGVDVDYAPNGTQNALTLAAANGQADVVNALLAAGANVNDTRGDGSSALRIASERRHIATVQVLLAAGAVVN